MIHRSILLIVAAAIASTSMGCKLLSKDKDKDRGVEGTGVESQPVGATATAKADKPARVAGCDLPANGQITVDFILKKGCDISLKNHIKVTNNATLTIEPGVTLRVDADRYVVVDKGKLVAKGTTDAPITFTSAAATKAAGDWVGIFFEDDTSAGTELEYVKMEYAGANKSGGKGALTIRSQRSAGRISIVNTVLENNDQAAVWSDSMKGRFARFENNRMQKNKWSVNAPAEVLGSIGAGNVFTDPLSTFGNVEEDASWPAFDAPVVVERNIIVAGQSSAPTLTIAPKTTVKMAGGKYIDVGGRNGGTLVARDVTFTSANATPQPGDWSGIQLQTRATNVDLTGSTVEYAGKGSGARAAITIRAKGAELAGLKASAMTFKSNLEAAVSTTDGTCAAFDGGRSEGSPLCKKN